MLIIISAPSGCGKSSVAKRLTELDNNIVTSISVTTRKPRTGEKDGEHYFFKTASEFAKLELIERAKIYGNLYGTPRDYVYKQLGRGKDVLFDIDWQGAEQILSSVKDTKIITIFLLPPSMSELKTRLQKRGQDSAQVIETRLQEAKKEISYSEHYDHVIVNNDFDITVESVYSLITQARR